MTNTPLNPDALEAAGEAIATRNGFGYAQFSHKGDANAAVRAYLVSLPVARLELTNAEWQEFQAIPDQGYSHRAWVDARLAERVATAQPVVNSVEELDALPTGTVVRDGDGDVWERWIRSWKTIGVIHEFVGAEAIILPASVLYCPEENDD